MSLLERIIRRPIATLTIVSLVMVIGVVSLWKAPLDLLPDIQPPLVAVITVFPGSSPQETLTLVTKPIEEQAAAIGGLTNLSSFSQENLSLVVLKFHWGSDLNSLRDEVSARLDLISFPEGVRRPIIVKFDPTLLPMMQVAVSGDRELAEMTYWLNHDVKPRLESIRGVASVQVQGGVSRDLFVRLDQELVNEHQVSFDQVAGILQATLLDIPAGITVIDQSLVRLRFLGRPQAIEELSRLVVGFQVNREVLEEMLGQSIDINLNRYLSDGLAVLEESEIPMRALFLHDITRDAEIDRENNLVRFVPEPDLLEQWGLDREQLLMLIPGENTPYLENEYLVVPLHPDYAVNWGYLEQMPLAYIPDFPEWFAQLKEKAGREVADLSSEIEQTLAGMASAMILASSGGGGGLEALAGESPLVPVYLDSIAMVELARHRAATINRVDGQPSVTLMIQKEGEANTVAVSRQVRSELREIVAESAMVEREINFLSTFDQGRDIELALGDLAWALLGGSLLAVSVLLAFLRNWRTVLIIGLSIPVAVVITFSILYFTNLTLNLMTLGSLALAAGMLVDNAIVVSENIYRHFQKGAGPGDAAVRGTREVAGAIVASTATTISVFFPVVFISGLAGQLFRDFALTVSCALIASLVIALTIIPLLASRFLRRRKESDSDINASNSTFYRGLLERILQYPWAVLAAGGAFILLGSLLYPQLGTNLFPSPVEKSFSVDITLRPGAPLEATDHYVAGLEDLLAEQEGIRSFTSRVGESQLFGLPIEGGIANQARVRVTVNPGQAHRIGELADEVRQKALSLPGEAVVTVTRESLLDVTGLETKLELIVEGEDLEIVNTISIQLIEKLADLEAITDVRSVLEESRPEIHIHLDHFRALQKGVTVYQVATVLRQALEGLPVARIETESGLMNLILGYGEREIATLEDLERVGFYSPSGSFLRLGEVASFTRASGPSSIPRENQRLVGIVEAQYQGDLGAVTSEALKAVEQIEMPPGYGVRVTGTSNLMSEVFDELWLVLALAGILVYLVMAAQFESLIYPFVIICSLPLAFTGGILALLLTGNSLNVPALIGAVVLGGILVNDGIIMVDYINQLRRRHNLPLRSAIIEGAAARLRPIMMTTITTILGLVPLTMGLGEGSQLQAPMGIVIIGGQIAGTILLLAVIPAVYSLVTRG